MPRTPATKVGKSKRTPAKHAFMDKLFGREIGSANRNPMFNSIAWYDLTAGDGVASEADREWKRSCSPGILANHAQWVHPSWIRRGIPPKPVTVHMYERARATFQTLLDNLSRELPTLGYDEITEGHWQAGKDGHVNLFVHHAPADTATIDHVTQHTAVMLVNDPNNVSQWACPAPLLGSLYQRSPCTLMLSTMGCNPAGLKRSNRDERARWYENTNAQISIRANWHDNYLCAIDRDADQWAYLLTAPRKWCEVAEEDAHKAFNGHGLVLADAWMGLNPQGFKRIADRLFLTKDELEASCQPMITGLTESTP